MDEELFARAAGIPFERAEIVWPFFLDALNEFDIKTHRRIAAFIAQTAHESANYTQLRENTHYSTAEAIMRTFSSHFGHDREDPMDYIRSSRKLANYVYANRGGNGPPESGDGYRFRAGGYIGITFRNGYAWMEELLDLPLVETPELIEDHEVAARTAGAYWANTKWNGESLNFLADQWAIHQISGLINRGSPKKTAAGALDRLRRANTALAVLKQAMT